MKKLPIRIANFIGWVCFGIATVFFIAAIVQFWTGAGLFSKLFGSLLILLASSPFCWIWSITPAGKASLGDEKQKEQQNFKQKNVSRSDNVAITILLVGIFVILGGGYLGRLVIDTRNLAEEEQRAIVGKQPQQDIVATPYQSRQPNKPIPTISTPTAALPPHQVIPSSLGSKGNRIQINVADANLTQTQCQLLVDAYINRALPNGQVSVHKPSSSFQGKLLPWCVNNLDGKGTFFNNDFSQKVKVIAPTS
ncbi:hypothetical protein [Pseudanabaena sp. PCC 6802]|uniref:hypothetical protein n=1 Tax=Pseudanabaena sp. PCC 6802 TaxID=118173 RepID=UPI000344C5D2|nr:hypothetical protein [Pseudanabaena sp. PCC 6802]